MSDKVTDIDLRYLSPFNGDAKPNQGKVKAFTLNDIWFTNIAIPNSPDTKNTELFMRTSIPKIEISEYQPATLIRAASKVQKTSQAISAGIGTLTSSAKALYDGLTSSSEDSDKEKPKKKSVSKDTLSKLYNAFVPEVGSDFEKSMYTVPMQYYRDMFIDTLEIAKFEIPYSGDFMLEANGQGGWEQSESDSVMKFAKNFLPTELPIIPEWKKSSDSDYMEFETNFSLYNHNIKALSNNFNFLWSFASGAFWSQLKYRQVSPNVYSVHIPGINYLFYTTMHIIVEQVGNRRRLKDSSFKKFKSTIQEKVSDNVTSFNIPESSMFPDGYKVTVKFKSLIPNNFNAAMYYFIYGAHFNETKET